MIKKYFFYYCVIRKIMINKNFIIIVEGVILIFK